MDSATSSSTKGTVVCSCLIIQPASGAARGAEGTWWTSQGLRHLRVAAVRRERKGEEPLRHRSPRA